MGGPVCTRWMAKLVDGYEMEQWVLMKAPQFTPNRPPFPLQKTYSFSGFKGCILELTDGLDILSRVTGPEDIPEDGEGKESKAYTEARPELDPLPWTLAEVAQQWHAH